MSGAAVLRSEWEPRVLSIVRIVVGLLFLEHGSAKLLGFPPGATAPAMFGLIWFAGVIELVGGALVAIGLFTRPGRLHHVRRDGDRLFHVACAGELLPDRQPGGRRMLYCFIFLYLVVAGGGVWSLDTLISGDRR